MAVLIFTDCTKCPRSIMPPSGLACFNWECCATGNGDTSLFYVKYRGPVHYQDAQTRLPLITQALDTGESQTDQF